MEHLLSGFATTSVSLASLQTAPGAFPQAQLNCRTKQGIPTKGGRAYSVFGGQGSENHVLAVDGGAAE